jgi:enoyl-CoA hydratase/carnithine racemase
VREAVLRDRLLPHIRALASEIAENAPLAAQTIQRINNWAERGLAEALELEAAATSVCFVSEDMQLDYQAMAAKDKAKFEGKARRAPARPQTDSVPGQ